MKVKEQTRKLAASSSKHCFEVADKTDEVSSKHCFEVADRTEWFEEILEEYSIKSILLKSHIAFSYIL
ncbi:hypothetical protein [Streptococcus pneumoniae]|uniref:hypothetical protein n=1 Tax=Streptococcus pneumoniae TaxID=1313 RepID=UPI000B58818D|nr:hypothetical protein [Streptococcus pneumoniae]SNF06771.1 chlorohydrolase [Streptococcus pneumoniae]